MLNTHGFTVWVERDSNNHDGQNDKLTLKDEGGHNARTKKSHLEDADVFKWCSNSGSLAVDFGNSHPFYSPPMWTYATPHCTDPVQVDPGGKYADYKYSVVLTDPNNQAFPSADPKVRIDSGKMLSLYWIGSGIFLIIGGYLLWRKLRRREGSRLPV